VLQRLTDADVAVAELSLRKPSLDEVFFALAAAVSWSSVKLLATPGDDHTVRLWSGARCSSGCCTRPWTRARPGAEVSCRRPAR
jgi:hypothetical protein